MGFCLLCCQHLAILEESGGRGGGEGGGRVEGAVRGRGGEGEEGEKEPGQEAGGGTGGSAEEKRGGGGKDEKPKSAGEGDSRAKERQEENLAENNQEDFCQRSISETDLSDFASKMKNRQMGPAGGASITKSTSVSGDMCNVEKTDGSQSDTTAGTVGTEDKKRRSSIGAKMQAIVGLSRKSRSTSQLSQTAGRDIKDRSGCLTWTQCQGQRVVANLRHRIASEELDAVLASSVGSLLPQGPLGTAAEVKGNVE
ncbi:hypothetical protein NHX12_001838 [Muraenolepis orangiensis]|uniref:Uncharacterized protein n=1 Tax=Muraenolepis orangiensis TaxID=630683 RepID=A0A9Q0E0G7_9TELE|nr:hypothetical protein NHX12_001838 [Muraenolepis orangiensis]